MGQDQDLIYLRRPVEESYDGKEMPFGDLPKFTDWRSSPWYSDLTVRTYIVGFCGKVYPILKLSLYRPNEENPHATCFKMEDVEEFMVKVLKKRDFADYENKDRWRRRGRGVLAARNRKMFADFWEKWAEKKDAFQHLFDSHKAPIFIANVAPKFDNDRKITYNGCLKDVEFFRAVEPFTAFQELSMYWGNVAQPNRPIPEVSDEDMLIAKGFDPKWSFRKEPAAK